jgi:hypothetical protein
MTKQLMREWNLSYEAKRKYDIGVYPSEELTAEVREIALPQKAQTRAPRPATASIVILLLLRGADICRHLCHLLH